jgi:hypothetical protein
MSLKYFLSMALSISVFVSFSQVYSNGHFHHLLSRVIPLLLVNGTGLSILLFLFLPKNMSRLLRSLVASIPCLLCSAFAFVILAGCGMSSNGCAESDPLPPEEIINNNIHILNGP